MSKNDDTIKAHVTRRLSVKLTAFILLLISAMVFSLSASAVLYIFTHDAFFAEDSMVMSGFFETECESVSRNVSAILRYWEPYGYTIPYYDKYEDILLNYDMDEYILFSEMEDYVDSHSYENETTSESESDVSAESPISETNISGDENIVIEYQITASGENEIYYYSYYFYDDYQSLPAWFSLDYDEYTAQYVLGEQINAATSRELTADDIYPAASSIGVNYSEGLTNFIIEISSPTGEVLYRNFPNGYYYDLAAIGSQRVKTSTYPAYVATVSDPLLVQTSCPSLESAASFVKALNDNETVFVLGYELSLSADYDGYREYFVNAAVVTFSEEVLTVNTSIPIYLSFLTVNDDTYLMAYWFSTLVSYKWAFVAAMGVAVLLVLAMFVILLSGAGYSENHEGVYLGFVHRVPFEIYLGTAIIVAGCAFEIVIENIRYSETAVAVAATALSAVAVTAAVMLTLMSYAARVKAHKFFITTLIIGIPIRIIRFIKRVLAASKRSKKLKLCFLAVVVYDILCFLVICSGGIGAGFFLLVLGTAVTAAIALIYASGVGVLEQVAKDISEGRTDTVIDESGLWFGLSKFAGYLGGVNEGIQTAVEENLRSERLKTELITNVSHDLKTPLTSIVNYVDLLSKEDIEPEAAKEYVEVLVRQSQRMKKLIDDLVEASKAQAGAIAVNLEKLDMSILLEQAAAEYKRRMVEIPLTQVLNLPEKPLMANVDGRLMWRVFDNLMGNIVKYAQPNTRVYISEEERDGNIEITFKNISRYELNITSDELMERFVRGDSSRSTEGSGLGLSIAKSLCDLQNVGFEIMIDGDLYKTKITLPALPSEDEGEEDTADTDVDTGVNPDTDIEIDADVDTSADEEEALHDDTEAEAEKDSAGEDEGDDGVC